MLLEKDGLSEELLKSISYKTKLNVSLKRNLHYFNYNELMRDINEYIACFDESLLVNVQIDYRIKSIQSICYKYKRYYPDHQLRKVFNDIVGFRGICESYEEVNALKEISNIRVADMTSGKSGDDGYRGAHVYYQIDNTYYPIEIQYNTLYDRQLNNWLHRYIYKKDKFSKDIGAIMRRYYEEGKIKTESDFKEVLTWHAI